MLIKYTKNILIIILLFIFTVQSIVANCMSARNTGASDADCYLSHLARENVMRMGLSGGCDTPRQQVVYPDDPSKMFMPRGTLLYRCNDQSGSCPQKEHSCQPIMEEELRVAFYAIHCNAGDSRPTPEYVMMKNHTKCGCRPKMDYNQGLDLMQTPQRLQDTVCGGGQRGGQMRAQPQQYPGYGMQGSQYGGSQSQPSYGGSQPSYPMSTSMSNPCANSGSSRTLMDGQVVRGTIRLTVGPKGFMNQQQQQSPCPYG